MGCGDAACARISTRRSTPRGATTRRSTACSRSGSLSSWTTNPKRQCSSRTTTSTSRPATCARRGPTPSSRTSSTSRGPSTGRSCRRRCGAPCTRACSRTTSSRSTPRAGRATSRRAAHEIVGGHRVDARHASRHLRSTPPSSTSSPGRTACSPRSARSRRRGRRSSCCASTGPIRRRTSSAASRRSASCSTRGPSGTAGRGCSRCSIRPGSRSPSTSSTSLRSSARPRRSTAAILAPIELRVADNFPQSVAAYKQFDVLLVNAVYDG